jgi:protein phosphatase
VDDLLSIGEFSSRCGLSIKMLRSYAGVGLLPPAAVDSASGYRYYSTGQLHQARVIGLLRRAGIGIDEIKEFLKHPESARIDRWDREIRSTSTSRRQALADARAQLALDDSYPHSRSASAQEGTEMTPSLAAATATHIGDRASNEDGVLISDRLYVVADGIGGLDNGEIASRTAIETLASTFAQDATVSGLLHACREANQAVWQQPTASPADAAMGTTLTALAITSDTDAVVVHVGDSRLYRLRDGRILQLTRDHTVSAEMVVAGELSEQDANTHPYQYVLTRAIGLGPDLDIDYAGVSLRPGDRFLLCTDGLFKALPPDAIKAALAAPKPQAAADILISGAVQHGAEDDVTALVIDID